MKQELVLVRSGKAYKRAFEADEEIQGVGTNITYGVL
jgi:hypothetical protein